MALGVVQASMVAVLVRLLIVSSKSAVPTPSHDPMTLRYLISEIPSKKVTALAVAMTVLFIFGRVLIRAIIHYG